MAKKLRVERRNFEKRKKKRWVSVLGEMKERRRNNLSKEKRKIMVVRMSSGHRQTKSRIIE